MNGPNRIHQKNVQAQWRRFPHITPLHDKQIKSSSILPLQWNNIWMKTLKKRKGSPKILNNYRAIFVVPILSIILEKLIKNRIMNTLRNNIITVPKWRNER